MNVDFEQLANALIDYIIDLSGIENACVYLMYQDFTNEQLELMGFDIETIEIARERIQQGGDLDA